MSSLLPIVAGVFENRRYGGGPALRKDRPSPSRLPDTAVASAPTEEDLVLCSEFDGIEARSPSSAYVALRLVEVGGDHSGSRRSGDADAIPLLEALGRSKSVLAKADAHAYFLNAKSLVEERDAPRSSRSESTGCGLVWGREGVLYVSREPDHVDVARIIDALPPTSSVVGGG